jgi:HNH endonuclease
MKHSHVDIKGYEGLYQISTSLKIKCLQPKALKKKDPFVSAHKHKTRTGKYYWRVNLYKNGKGHGHFLHVLLGIAFVPGYKPGLEINHVDGDGLNDALDNLEWVTHQYNILHASKTLNRKMGKGIPVALRKGKRVYKFESIAEAGRQLNLRAKSLCKLLSGERKTHREYSLKRCTLNRTSCLHPANKPKK